MEGGVSGKCGQAGQGRFGEGRCDWWQSRHFDAILVIVEGGQAGTGLDVPDLGRAVPRTAEEEGGDGVSTAINTATAIAATTRRRRQLQPRQARHVVGVSS